MLRPAFLIAASLVVFGYANVSYAQAGEGEGEGAAAGEGEGEGAAAGEGEGEGAAAGEGEGEGAGGCGDVSVAGECNGNVAEFCGQDQAGNPALQTIDCTADITGATATCASMNNEYGVDCTVVDGAACSIDDGQGGQTPILCAPSSTAACRVGADGGATCVSNSSQCAAADGGTCRGTVFVLACEAILNGDTSSADGQPIDIDCATIPGSTCTDGVGCLVAAGGTCNPASAFGQVVISQCGSAADPTDCPASGACPAGTGEGEGEGAAAGEGEGEGEGEGAAKPSCSADASGTTVPAASLVFLGGALVVVARRRRR
jgi:hypothetical protein